MRDILGKMREIRQNAGFPTRLRDGWHLCNIINWYIIQLASNAIQHVCVGVEKNKNDSYKLLHLIQGM